MNASNQKETGQDQEGIPTIQEIKSWDYEELLEWIQQTQPHLLANDENVSTFKAAKISGSTFLRCAEDLDLFRRTHLPRGVYYGLASLAREVRRQNDQPNQIAGRRRKGEEIDAPEEPFTSSKRCQVYKEIKIQWTIEANKRRKAIRDMITQMNDSPDQHSNSVDPLPGAVDKLSDPTLNHTLDFPFSHHIPPRFRGPGRAQAKWSYMGRTMFKDLLNEVREVRKSRVYRRIWLYGNEGFGKSHLLAALVCYLAAQDERVVYLPNCWELLEYHVHYVKLAMLFAWADDFATQKKIMALYTEDEIQESFRLQKNVIFVVDEMNAFKAKIGTCANSTDDLEEINSQTLNRVVRVYGGFTKASSTEMEQWWKQHKDIKMGGYSRYKVEDVTGCIPLLLKQCVVNGVIDMTPRKWSGIYNESMVFAQRIWTTATVLDWKWYCAYTRACIRNRPVPPKWTEHIELVDHRFFYQDNFDIGRYTCGLVRDAVANQLLELDITFNDIGSLASLRDFIYNRSVLKFMVEYAILESIQSKGLKVCDGSDRGMGLRFFRNEYYIRFDMLNTPVLYRPERTDYKTIDGMIISVKTKRRPREGEKQKLLVFPIQITVAKNYSNSRLRFLREYRQWAIDCRSTFDIELEFLWITPDKRDVEQHPPHSPWPEHREHYIPFEEISRDIWTEYQKAEKAREEGEEEEEEETEEVDA
ncbi:uncharacterized protein Z518_04439 [Rhinocladiella mackenziei CBS 650.93]|uniref:Rhinocladiella mackenziei CBS 650.93 unplaced genomic scaffold supercont1.3, whole genome shotgun sequence n=1 Tax=Rhinocladiella mackenziei CBS 650.93 TaxID=1442369 RepID=A0A0D2H7T5_9EURO|nr:uncharacterized protein Z518_04439 [Rhinocladiella mackenziei CBS 650.93]KIX06463.1 hypothetical protein Z518_04439 [Rhinocladiella mackenziei CBS 650.93]